MAYEGLSYMRRPSTMATWHQRQPARRGHPVRLSHTTQWTVVSDPPGALTTCMSFTSEAKALDWQRGRLHTFILPPHGAGQ